ncbi:MAG: plastocyanin/azurin family copper-binding protein [Saprospiraceae bacterium]
MKNILIILLIAAVASIAQAQTTHNVTVQNHSFNPANLSIQVGDTVRWTNNSGSHNVNGTTATFPSNPESFGNSVGTNWVFTHVFMTAGEYDYQCNPHAAMGMTGEITVTPVSSVSEAGVLQASVFPNPAHDFVAFEFEQEIEPGSTLLVYDMAGSEMARLLVSGRSVRLETGSWPGGMYLYQVFKGKTLLSAGQVIIQH